MMYNELLIVIILLILLIVVVSQIIKTNSKENFGGGGLRSRVHSRETCNNFPFENDECSSDEYLRAAGDIHLDYSSEAFPNYMSNYNIHMVYPKDPCCLRTCINDFTYTEENTPSNSPDRNRLGQYRQFIDNCFRICNRQALHAKTLGFFHPETNKWLEFDSEIPDDMSQVIDKWRKYSRN